MKIKLTILLLMTVLGSISTYGQAFLSADSRQGIYYHGNVYGPEQAVSLQHFGDTTICGYNYDRIKRFPFSAGYFFYLRKINGKVYQRIDLCSYPEWLLYDFSLVVNDTISLDVSSCYGGLFGVDSVYNITLLNGSIRKYMVLKGRTTYNQNVTLRWIEDIGDIDRGFFADCDFEGGRSSFICHKENGQILWVNLQNQYLADCDSITTSSTDINNNLSANEYGINIFPNPTAGRINISLSKNIFEAEVHLFNEMGEKVYSETFNGKEKTIDCKLNEGIYFVEVTNGQEVWTKKILKQ